MPATALATSRTTMWVDLGLVKAGPVTDAPWLIYVQASAPKIDHEGELIVPRAMQRGMAYFLENGQITYEHVDQSTRHDPSILIGRPLRGLVTPDGRTLVEGRLYERAEKAQHVWNILQSGGRLKASIGGAVLARDPEGGAVITDILWTHLALTSWPVNEDTGVSLMPYGEFLAKALGATVGTSVQPLVREDLEGAMLAGTPDLLAKWQALTDVLVRTLGLSVTVAKREALRTLEARGETRRAHTSDVRMPVTSP